MKSPKGESESGGMNLGLRAIGGSLGFVNPENTDAALTLGVFADWGRIAPKIALEPRLDYWSKSYDVSGASAKVRDVSLGVRGKYLFETSNPKLQPYAGAGLSAHFLHAEATVPGFATTESSTTKLGLDLGGGFSSPIGPRSTFVGEGWYGVVDGSNRFSMRAGLSYRLH